MSKLNSCTHCGASLAGASLTYQLRTHAAEQRKETFALRTSLVGYFCGLECVSLYAIKRNAMLASAEPGELPKKADKP